MSASYDIDLPDLTGTRAVITGGNSGIGLEAARRLAGAGADVVIAVRNPAKGAAAVADIAAGKPRGTVSAAPLDVASLASVEAFATTVLDSGEPIDMLINNAGIMAVPRRETTADGHELQLGTNHLGHFALTARLFPALRTATAPRLVTVSSAMALFGRIHLDDLESAKRYRAWPVYSQSKLANLMFAMEFDRRSKRLGWGITSTACHPGSTRTNLQSAGPNMGRAPGRVDISERMQRMPGASMSPAQGALPTLLAATSAVSGGEFFGPGGLTGMTGAPKKVSAYRSARHPEIAARLWAESERLVGVSFPTA